MKAFVPGRLPDFDALFAFDYAIEPSDEESGRAARETLTVRRRADGAVAFRKTWLRGATFEVGLENKIGLEDHVHPDYDVGDTKAVVSHWMETREGS